MNIFKNFRGYYKIFGFRGVAFAINEKVFGGYKEVKITPLGVMHPVSLRLNSSDMPTYKQVFQDEEYKFDFRKKPNVIVDAGANVGLSSIYFANQFPNALVIAIEPVASNFSLLKRNAEAYPNIVPVCAALWGENSMIEIFDPGLGEWGFQTKQCDQIVLNGSASLIQGITIGRIIEEYGLEKIDLLKIDIEGAEKEVFKTSEEWIDKIDFLAVELHDRTKVGCSRSFYNATNGFSTEWYQGELVCLARGSSAINHM